MTFPDILILVAIGVLAWLILVRDKFRRSDNRSDLLLQNQMNELTRTLDSKLGELPKVMRQQFSESAKIIKDVTERLTKLDETNKQVINFTDQLKNLQDILKNPKQRGVLGEYYLETLLKNVMPPGTYEMQYDLGVDEDTGQKLIADAVIKVKGKLIPVDSKFSLENYNRLVEAENDSERDRFEKAFVNDLKERIKETSKYIRPKEGTLDFAFMFIPHEAIYYDLLINKIGAVQESTENLVQRAAGKHHVIIVSPTSFLAYLQTVLHGLRALQIEESAKEIRKRVEDLGRHLLNHETYMKKLGSHLGTTVNSYNTAYKELGKIDKDVMRISGEAAGIEPEAIEGPKGLEEE